MCCWDLKKKITNTEGHFDNTNMLDCYTAKSVGARSKNATKFRNKLQSKAPSVTIKRFRSKFVTVQQLNFFLTKVKPKALICA